MRQPKTPDPANALAPATREVALLRPAGNQELAHLADEIEQTRLLAEKSRAKRTRERYQQCWRKFEDWCASKRLPPVPADIGTLCLYVNHLVVTGFAVSSLDQAFAAIRYTHSMRQLSKEETPDWQDIRLQEVRRAARRDISGRRGIRRARPITDEDMRAAFMLLRTTVLRECRDLAVLALAYAGCRRRSEITGLDYAKRGDGGDATGHLEVAPDGLTIVLLRSKTSQEGEPKRFFINRIYNPRSCAAVEAWIKLARIAPGTPVLRGLRGSGAAGEFGVTVRPSASEDAKLYRAHWRRRFLGRFATRNEAAATVVAAAAADGITVAAGGVVQSGRYSDNLINAVIQRRMFEVLCRRLLEDTKRKRLRPEEMAALKKESREFAGHSGRRGALKAHFERGGTRADAIAMSGHVPGSAMLDIYSVETDAKRHKFGQGSNL